MKVLFKIKYRYMTILPSEVMHSELLKAKKGTIKLRVYTNF